MNKATEKALQQLNKSLHEELQQRMEALAAEEVRIERMVESKLIEFAEVNQLVVPEGWSV